MILPCQRRGKVFRAGPGGCQASCWRLGPSWAGATGRLRPCGSRLFEPFIRVIQMPMKQTPGCLVRQSSAQGLLCPCALGCTLEQAHPLANQASSWRPGLLGQVPPGSCNQVVPKKYRNIRVIRHLRGQAELGPEFRQGFSCATANENDPRRTEGAATCSERLAPCMLTAFSVNA